MTISTSGLNLQALETLTTEDPYYVTAGVTYVVTGGGGANIHKPEWPESGHRVPESGYTEGDEWPDDGYNWGAEWPVGCGHKDGEYCDEDGEYCGVKRKLTSQASAMQS